jgi:hypothetical protein
VFRCAAVLLLLSWPASAESTSITRSPSGKNYRMMIALRYSQFHRHAPDYGGNLARPVGGTALQSVHYEKPTDS